MRVALVTLCLFGCVKSPVADPGTPVGRTHTAPAGSFVVTECPSRLDGDDGGYSPLYLVDAKGTVTRWTPDPMPGGESFDSSAATDALYFDAFLKMWALSPDGTVRVIDEHPGHDESRFESNGTHRLVVIEKSLQWRSADGGTERTFALDEFPDHVYPAPGGERAVVQLKDATALVDARGATTLLDDQRLIAASWSPDGRQVALVTLPIGPRPTAYDERALLWRAKLDGSPPLQLALPERPGPGLVDRVLGRLPVATAMRGVVWTNDGLVILSNHESECWPGSRDVSSGCYWALYRLSPEGGVPVRLSPRAFRCQALFQLR